MTYHTNLHTAALVREDGPVYTESGMAVPAAEVRFTAIAEQAGHWLAFATERTRMKPATITAKALASVAFSVHHRAASLAVPSKLVGTSKRQHALWALVRDPAEPWAALDVEAADDGLLASFGGEPLGLVQSKHVGWARPLVPFGLTVHLAKVTGSDYDGYTLGANVAFGNVGAALDRLLAALGSGDGAGDGTAGDEPSVAVVPAPGDGGSGPVRGARALPARAALRLVTGEGVEARPEGDAVRPGADPDDVVLVRRVDGTATATVPHAVRHSPSGIEWGFGGSGPADLARSVLLALTDEATAEALYQAFKAEVVARVPFAGGVLRATEVRAWAAAQGDRPPAA